MSLSSEGPFLICFDLFQSVSDAKAKLLPFVNAYVETFNSGKFDDMGGLFFS